MYSNSDKHSMYCTVYKNIMLALIQLHMQKGSTGCMDQHCNFFSFLKYNAEEGED